MSVRITGASAAMGPRDGDYIQIHNAWHVVTITRAESERGGYYINGESGEHHRATLAEAMADAWAELAEYERGRCD